MTQLNEPFPKVLIFEMSWSIAEIDFVELLKYYISIREYF